VDIALKRVQNANRFERYDLQERVRDGFLDEASKNPEKVKVINGNQSVSRVSEDILSMVLSGGNI
ncbi:MAG: dTMP kinase, partial [Caldisericia bacterium]